MTAPRAASRAERARQAELRELAALMRERGGMPAVPEPPALHQIAARKDDDHDRGQQT